MQLLTTIEEVRAWRQQHLNTHCASVLTMGALHRGHMTLVESARAMAGPDGTVLVTVFVNPTQFSNGNDLDSYPRTLTDDLAMCREAGVDAVFAPAVSQMYPTAQQITVQPGPIGDVLEGASRPGHFAGMLTVVTKLLSIVTPESSHFGEKDYQQLAAVRMLVRELNLPVTIVGVPTARDHDGLALSSRNVRLTPEGRARAVAIPRALMAVQLSLQSGASVQQALDQAHALLHHEGVTDVDYLVVTGPDLGPVPSKGAARVLIAATIDGIRLLDNGEVVI